MVTAEQAFEAKKLASRYGVPGKVAARYRMAGYEVEMLSNDPKAPLHFRAWKRRESLAVRVYWSSGKVPANVVEELASNAEGKGRPVLVLYGAGPRVSEELLSKAKELGVSVRRVRPS